MKSKLNCLANQKGFSIIETLVGLALIGIVMATFIGGLSALQDMKGNADELRLLNREVNDIIESIRPNLKSYQISYDESKSNAERLAVGSLPMAWGNGVKSTAEKCPNCPGRFGYVIQSYEGYFGLYLVTVRFSHKKWAGMDNPTVDQYGFVDYEFVVNVQ